MKLTNKEKEMLENLINNDFFCDEQSEDCSIFLGYIGGGNTTNEEKGIIGSLAKKKIIIIDNEDDWNDFTNRKVKITDVWLNCLGKDREKFIDSNLEDIGPTYQYYKLKSNTIDDSTLDL